MENKLLLSATEVSNLLGLSRPSVYPLLHRADFPMIRIGGRVLVPVDGLRVWLTQQVQNGEEAKGL